jgi:hypothetical protein
VLLNRIKGLVRSSKKARGTPAATLPGLSLGRVWDSMWQLLSPGIAWEPKGTVSSLMH